MLKQASAHVKYVVGLLGLIKLLLPPFIPAAISGLFAGANVPEALIKIESPLPVAALPQAITAPAAPELSLKSTIFLVWAGAALLYVVLALGSTLLLRWKLKRAVALEGEAPGRPPVRLLQSTLISSPLSIGLAPKQIFVPTYWRALPGECRTVLLNHELAHIKRRDGLAQMLQILAQAIYFFHPLVWLLNERLNEYREMACDDAALQETNLSPEVYSHYLLHVAERVTHPHWSYVSASALIKQKSKLLQRINYQIREAAMKSSTKNVALVFVLLAVLVAPLSLYSKKSNDKVGGNEAVMPTAEKEAPETQAFSEKPEILEKKKIAYDEAPKPIGGFAAIQKNLRYPEMARKTGVEGRVYVNAFIDENGVVKEAKILKSLGSNGCDAAAIEAIKATKWQPARKDGKPVAVWLGIPVVFKLNREKEQTAPPPPSLPETVPPPMEGQSSKPAVPSSFVAYDTPPQPIGGFAAIQKNVQYPEQARKAGVEGSVNLSVFINEKGQVEKAIVDNSLGNNGCDEAAIEAVKAVKWEPAIKNGKPVAVWVGVSVDFSLTGNYSGKNEKNNVRSADWKRLGIKSLTFTGDIKYLDEKKFDIIYLCEFNRNGTVKKSELIYSKSDKLSDAAILEYFETYAIISIADDIEEPLVVYVGVVLNN